MKERYILLSYVNRSGSTMLSYQLSRSPSICVCPEAENLFLLFCVRPFRPVSKKRIAKLNKLIISDKKLSNWKLNKVNYNEIAGLSNIDAFLVILSRYKQKVKPQAQFVLFKDQSIIRYLTKTVVNHQNLYFLLLKRSAIDIVNSQLRSILPHTAGNKTNKFSVNPILTFQQILFFQKSVNSLSRFSNCMVVSYESLTEDYPSSLHTIFYWLKTSNHLNPESDYMQSLLPSHRLLHKNATKKPQVLRQTIIVDDFVQCSKKVLIDRQLASALKHPLKLLFFHIQSYKIQVTNYIKEFFMFYF